MSNYLSKSIALIVSEACFKVRVFYMDGKTVKTPSFPIFITIKEGTKRLTLSTRLVFFSKIEEILALSSTKCQK